MNRWIHVSAAALLAGALSAAGSLIGSDNAGNYTSWTNGSNGGTGFRPWTFTNNGTGSESLGDSSLGLDGNTTLNTGGKAFVVSSGNEGTAYAYRFFEGGPLSLNQTLQVQMGVNSPYASSSQIDILDASSNVLYYFAFSYEPFYGTPMYLHDGQGESWPYKTDSILTITLMRTNDLQYWVGFSRNDGNSWTGSATLSAEVAGLRLMNSGSGDSAGDHLYANNLSITNVPEPSSVFLMGLGALVLTLGRRRRVR